MMEYGASATMILLNLSGCFFVVSTIFQTVKNGLQSLIPGELEEKILPIILSVLELIFNKISSFWFFRYLRPIKKRIPTPVRNFFFWLFGCFPGNESTEITLVIDEVVDGHTSNLMFEASELFLRSKITFSMDKLKIRKIEREKKLLISAEDGQYIYDDFHDIPISWKLNSSSDKDPNTDSNKNRYFELSFEKEFYDTVFNSYLSHVLDRATAIKEENKILKLYSLGIDGDRDSGWLWGSVKLDHPSTFETLAMDSKVKADLLEDLDRFVKRREFYKRVGKAWKRGYLLYGPPGTGKSSLIAAMANHLGFHIYDLELGSVYSNKQFRKLLVATANRSILVIEDIDCTVELQDRSDRKKKRKSKPGNDLSLSGLLNFIDGLWSSVGDERIIICTTNHKDKLDPALLRPGRMDMHINMSYMTPSGFKTLVYNYLKINDHILFKELEKLIEEVNVTPAEIAEELMKSDVVDIALKGLVEFLQGKKTKVGESKTEVEKKDDEEVGESKTEVEKKDDEESQKEKIKNKKKNKKIKKKKK